MTLVSGNRMRWQYGDENAVFLTAHSNHDIWIGNMVGLSDDNFLVPIDTFINRNERATRFVGVAMQASPHGQENVIRVATSGVFAFEQYRQNQEFCSGWNIRPLDSVTVVPCTSASCSIGIVVKQIIEYEIFPLVLVQIRSI